jgi:hypothetical protein
MDMIFLKIKVKNSNKAAENMRNEGLFFSNIVHAIEIDRDDIIEIDETNYKSIIQQIKNKINKSRPSIKRLRGS